MNKFQAAYQDTTLYEDTLPPHLFEGREDVTIIAERLAAILGQDAIHSGGLNIVEFGVGTGRVSEALMPYAKDFLAVDNSPEMLDEFGRRFPSANILCLDMVEAVDTLLVDGRKGTFDLIGAFWSLSYPIGNFFETLTTDGIEPVDEPADARLQAENFIRKIVQLLKPGGHLMVLFFDSDSSEQRVVSSAWERVAPHPEGGRDYSRKLLTSVLMEEEWAGHGALTVSRLPGKATCPDAEAAGRWFQHLHFKDLPALLDDREVSSMVSDFVDEHTQSDGTVHLPCGVYLMDFSSKK
ncbi:class I SAM-dependent DNA methyltransferase [Paenarthrobacter sp. NPDC089989]|uniref:class I SAM-dependent DNA methyltransferase n=1 Tax=unclassified Paenarthrobacter TaxID=2634190 RepID=UPI0037F5D6E1